MNRYHIKNPITNRRWIGSANEAYIFARFFDLIVSRIGDPTPVSAAEIR
jgi:hypothetical protein